MSSSGSVTIYISAAPELAAERDALARMIADLPVTLAWQIVQTPPGGVPLDRQALRATDLHMLLMGNDIQAPVGLERDVVRRAGRPSVAFLKQDAHHTPAGRAFVNQTDVQWQRFTDTADLWVKVQRLLVNHLLQHAQRYALTPLELEQLEELREAQEEGEKDRPEREVADHSAVILSRERFEPSEGVVVEEPE